MTREEKKRTRVAAAEDLVDILEAAQDRLIWLADRLKYDRGMDVNFIHDLKRSLDRAEISLKEFDIFGENLT